MLYATDLCDSACKHCLIWTKRPVNYLPFEKMKEIMQSKCVTRNTSIGLEGGEFLLHPHAIDILQWFEEHHKNFDLLSNGLNPSFMVSAVKKHPPRRLYISLDGTKSTYEHMRGKDGYDGIINAIESLHKTLPISLMFTLSPYNDYSDLEHVANICLKYNIDLRIGVYNDIAFFDTVDKAHQTGFGQLKHQEPYTYKKAKALMHEKNLVTEVETKTISHEASQDEIPAIVKKFSENYDFLVLYNQWRKNQLHLKCFSILDSLVVLPNGDVPICQNKDVMIGNVHSNSLDEIFNSAATIELQKHYVTNCNDCWINFHRKYDVVLYRSFEKYFGSWVTSKLFGHYQWDEDNRSYAEVTR